MEDRWYPVFCVDILFHLNYSPNRVVEGSAGA